MEWEPRRRPDPYADLGPPPPYEFNPPEPSRQPRTVRPTRSVPDLRHQNQLRPSDADYAAFPGVDPSGRLRAPSPSPSPSPGLSPGWGTYNPYRGDVDVSSLSRTPTDYFGAGHSPRQQQQSHTFPVTAGADLRRPSTQGRSSGASSPLPPSPSLLSSRPGLPVSASEQVTSTSSTITGEEPPAKEKTGNFLKTAFDETVFFAGGLIPHPAESTRHHTILRHSPALVWYRGPTTSVTITIFSDAALPPTRTLWLQRKGFSGNTGMNLKSLLGANESWLDVTPAARTDVSALPPTDERGYQRDITKFLKKSSGTSSLKKQVARETHVVRIPAAAEDGYFRLILCAGGGGGNDGGKTKRKVLCPSPIFRIASTSTDASVVRGASLSTAPIEFGVMVGTTIANQVVNRYVGPARMAATAAATGAAKRVEKKTVVAARARELALAKASLRKGYGKMEAKYAKSGPRGRYAALQGDGYFSPGAGEAYGDAAEPDAIGDEEGPAHPFPVKMTGKVVKGTGRGGMELGIPTANLDDVPEEMRLRMRGVYMAWACVVPGKAQPEGISNDWHEAIVTVGPSPYAGPRVVARNEVTVHFIHEFGGAMFFGAKVKVLIMGQLRRGSAGGVSPGPRPSPFPTSPSPSPSPSFGPGSTPAPSLSRTTTTSTGTGTDILNPSGPPTPTPLDTDEINEALQAYATDILITVASLGRDAWGPLETRQRMKTLKSERTFTERYVDARDKVQKQVDRVPVHWAGVRSEGAAMRDEAIGAGGIWIQR